MRGNEHAVEVRRGAVHGVGAPQQLICGNSLWLVHEVHELMERS